MTLRKLAVLVSTLLVLAMLGTTAASGQTGPRSEQYGNGVQEEDAPAPAARVQAERPTGVAAVREALPFTGLEAGIVLLAGAGAAATGLALRRSGRNRKT